MAPVQPEESVEMFGDSLVDDTHIGSGSLTFEEYTMNDMEI